MEYEKKYNDLIARINAVKDKPRIGVKDEHYYNGYVETGIRDALDYIVSPESEDERIRKFLIDILSHGTWQKEWPFGPNEVVAYLERQKDFKYSEEQMEDIRQYAYNKGIVDAEEKQKEQQPAEWSKEDEKMLKDVYESLYAYQCDIRAGIMDKNALELLKIVDKEKAWLKSLRPQPHWKPSKEQMDHLAYAYTQLKLQKCYAPHVYESLGSLYDDLKKLI